MWWWWLVVTVTVTFTDPNGVRPESQGGHKDSKGLALLGAPVFSYELAGHDILRLVEWTDSRLWLTAMDRHGRWASSAHGT